MIRVAEPMTKFSDRDGHRWLSIGIDHFRDSVLDIWPDGSAGAPAGVEGASYMSSGAVYLSIDHGSAETWLSALSGESGRSIGLEALPALARQAAFSVDQDFYPLNLDRLNAGYVGARVQFHPEVRLEEMGLSGSVHIIEALDEFAGWEDGRHEGAPLGTPSDHSGFLVRDEKGAGMFVPSVGAPAMMSIEPAAPALERDRRAPSAGGPEI